VLVVTLVRVLVVMLMLVVVLVPMRLCWTLFLDAASSCGSLS
jgi:hypothetical protein